MLLVAYTRMLYVACCVLCTAVCRQYNVFSASLHVFCCMAAATLPSCAMRRDFVLKAMGKDCSCLHHAPDQLKQDKLFILRAVSGTLSTQ